MLPERLQARLWRVFAKGEVTLRPPEPASSTAIVQTHEDYAMHTLSRRAAGCLVVAAAAYPLAVASGSLAADSLPLAIKGYDPVAYFDAGQPTLGTPDLEYTWQQHRYRFSTLEHRDAFKADPAHYAPQFGNFCAMALSLGQLVVADPENWLINDGKLYVFGKPAPAGPALFKKDLAGNMARAEQNRSLIEKH
jgi:hypothetical protein